ncbi:MAG: glycosyltransferase family 4 protein [Myxococcota bacterium]
MRVALIQKKLRWAGQPQHVFSVARGLHRRGHELFLIAQPGSVFAARARSAGLRVVELPLTTRRRAGSLPLQIGAALWLTRFLRRERIEILHCHDSRDHQIGAFASAVARVPLIRTKHNTLPLRNAASVWLSRSRTAHVIAVSDAVRHGLVSDGVPPDHVTTVYGFVDTDLFRPRPPDSELRRALGLPEAAPVVGTLGRLHRAKGIGDLVRALPRIVSGIPDVRFLFVGGSHLWWPPRVKELGLEDRCVFTDSVPNPADYLSLMDVAVFPTLHEAFGLSILEALAAGLPVIATRVGGVPELIEDGRNGLLVEPSCPEAMARAVLRLQASPELAQRLAHEGQRTATEVFTEKCSLDALEDVYDRVRGH